MSGKGRRQRLMIARVAVLLLAATTVLSYFGEWHFVLDIFANFKPQYSVAFLVLAVVFAIVRAWGSAVVAVVGWVVNVIPIIPWYTVDTATPESAIPVSVLVANVFMRNTDYDRVKALISEEEPDVVGLMEVNASWIDHLQEIRDRYPYRVEVPHDRYFGLALFSKLPIKDSRIVHFGEKASPTLVATIDRFGAEFELILAHPAPPMDARRAALRNEQLQEMGRYIQQHPRKDIVVAGDLNTTMWSSYYEHFSKQAGLRNARAGYGIGATWPPVAGFGAPIDHILATKSLAVNNFRVHRRIGSDHLPISADVWLHELHAKADKSEYAVACDGTAGTQR